MIFNLLQTVTDTTALAGAMAPVQQEMKLSLIDMATKGGLLMVVLLLLSVMAIYIFGSKWWMIRRASSIDKHFMKDIHDNSAKAAEQYGLGYNLVAGANIAGFIKVAEAMMAQGIF